MNNSAYTVTKGIVKTTNRATEIDNWSLAFQNWW